MPSGFLTPDARLRILTDLGVVAPGAKLHTYVAGTPATPLATYSDIGLTVPNANPIVASAGGLFGPIFLTPATAYKLVLTDASDNAIWSQDNIVAGVSLLAGTGISLSTTLGVTTITATGPQVATIGVNDFRCTLESGVPKSANDQTAKTTLFCTPSGRGNRIDLYDAAGAPTTYISAQFSIAIPASTSQLYDIFVFNNAGVPTLELLAWTNDTTRATALVLTTTGTYTKSGDLTRRYVGSVRTTGVSGQTEDSYAKRYLWNLYHQQQLDGRVFELVDSWNYTLAAWQQANANTANQLDFVIGIAEVALHALATITYSNSGANIRVNMGIGEDSTTPSNNSLQGLASNPADIRNMLIATLDVHPTVGRHFYPWSTWSTASGTTTWYGDNGGAQAGQSGITGWIQG